MKVLAFDCSTEILSVALQFDERQYFGSVRRAGLNHSECLLPEIAGLLKKSDVTPAELDLIVCTKGPGSFTGLRIGISTAKGLAAGNNCPMVGVYTCDLLSAMHIGFDGLVVPIIDARKNRVYTAIYDGSNRISEYLDISPLNLFKKLYTLNRKVLFTGPDPLLMREAADDQHGVFFLETKGNTALPLIELGVSLYRKNGPDSDSSGPVYLRSSEAEIGRGQKNNC